MSTTPEYRRLPGRSQCFFGLAWLMDLILFVGQNSSVEQMRLYDGGDHLLLVRRKFFSERVNRFYLSDIQALTVRRTGASAYLHLLFFALGLLVPLLALFDALPEEPAYLWALGAYYGLLLALILLHITSGPVCVTEIHTAVARVRLTNLGRWRTAKRLLAALEPRIRAAQAEAAPLDLAELPLVTAQQSAPPALIRSEPTLQPGNARETAIFSWLILLCGVSAVFDVFFYSILKNIGDCLLFASVIIVGAVGYGRIRKTSLPPWMKMVHVAGLSSLILLYYVSQAIITVRAMLGFAAEQEVSLDPLNDPVLHAFSIIAAVTFLLIALWGLGAVWRYRNARGPLRGYSNAE